MSSSKKGAKNMRLLLAEDEKELSDALVAVLKHNNYSVDAVYNGQDAIDFLEAAEYDGAILDIMMPKVDGLDSGAYDYFCDIHFYAFYVLDKT